MVLGLGPWARAFDPAVNLNEKKIDGLSLSSGMAFDRFDRRGGSLAYVATLGSPIICHTGEKEAFYRGGGRRD